MELLELRWLSGQPGLAAEEARSGYDGAIGRVDRWTLGTLAIWLWRLRAPGGAATRPPGPFALEIAGDWQGAAAAWDRLGRPYDAALARLGSSDEAGLRHALPHHLPMRHEVMVSGGRSAAFPP